MEPDVEAAFATQLATTEQLGEFIQGIPKGQPNPVGIVGNRDLYALLQELVTQNKQIIALLQKK